MSSAMAIVQYPWLLALAVLLPALAVALTIIAARRRRARLARLGTPALVARLVPPSATRAPWPRALMLGLATALAAIAFAGPRWGSERTQVRGEGIDIVLALDASLSMLARDERPSRLERMKQEVRRFRSLSGGDRVALIAFAGRSYILTPLTMDAGALDLFLDNLDPGVVGQAGSSLARAIRQGTDLLLATKTGSDRAIVLMSDGEGFEAPEDVATAAARAAENGISIVTVGFGTERGTTIPVAGATGEIDKRDADGNVVITRYSPALLRAAADAAKGTFIAAGETDKAAKIRRAISGLRTQRRATETGVERTPRFQLFLLPALLLLLLDTIVAERRGRARRGAAASATAQRGAAAAAVLLLLVGACRPGAADSARAAQLYASGAPLRAAALYKGVIDGGARDAETVYNYGTSLLAADSTRAATEPLERAATSKVPEVRYRALFNGGLAHLKPGLAAKGDSGTADLDATLVAYKQVLLLRPADMDAKWNYELALRKKKSGGGGGWGGGGGGQAPSNTPDPSAQAQSKAPRPSGGLGQQQAEQLLNSAARDERDVQGKKQRQSRAEPPPGGKDWE